MASEKTMKSCKKSRGSQTEASTTSKQPALTIGPTIHIPMNTSNIEPVGRMTNIYNNSVVKYYNFLFYELDDPRTRDWFLMSSPLAGGSILAAYLYFVLSWGPKYMAHRKAYELKNVLVFYNFMQVCLSIYIFVEGLSAAWLKNYSWQCQPVDYSNSPDALRVAHLVYLYFVVKMIELLDTIFFVLRKKDKHISFLHVYHHTSMPMAAWGAVKYYPGGHGTFLGVVNAFVHILMYTYYLLSSLIPQKYLWWKKYITILQLGQFLIVFLHYSQLLFYDCDYPKWTVTLIIPNVAFFFLMFLDFYKAAYTKKSVKSTKSEDAYRSAEGVDVNNQNGKQGHSANRIQSDKGKTE